MIETRVGRISTPEERNQELLARVLDHIEHNQETWDQSVWAQVFNRPHPEAEGSGTSCKAAYCFAGWTAILEGVESPKTAYIASDWGITADLRSVETGWPGYSAGDPLPVRDWAGQRLGISACEADQLFNGTNKLSDVREMVGGLIRGSDILSEYHEDDNDCFTGNRCSYHNEEDE